MLFFTVLNSYLSPTPENIKNYTVITEVNNDDEEDTNNRYIVVGEYNGDFVCMKISNAYDKKGDKIDLTSDKDLKYSAIEIKKYEFEFISKEDIEVLNSYHFNDVKVIESENS